MKALNFSPARCLAALPLLILASALVAPGCGGSSHTGGTGGARAGSGGIGAAGNGGATGSGGLTGATDGGGDLRADQRPDVSGTGGMIVIVDASGNTFTCAQLLACCNSGTDALLKAACLAQYDMLLPMGNAACGNLLANIKANGLCP